MRSRLLAVIRKETLEVARDPLYLVLAIVVPIVVTSLLALGFVLDVKNLPVAFYDMDRSPLSREYMYSFTNSEYFRLVTIVNSAEELDRLIDDIAATGYGLTLGIASRIDTTIRHIVERLSAGNIYVNRNIIGAVVGTQPFGGSGLSGTGPKAGGPNYLRRFAQEQVVTVNTTAVGGNASLLAEQS